MNGTLETTIENATVTVEWVAIKHANERGAYYEIDDSTVVKFCGVVINDVLSDAQWAKIDDAINAQISKI